VRLTVYVIALVILRDSTALSMTGSG
jgi:hypothetical protein